MTDRMTERIHLTNRQRKKLMPLIMGVEEGGAVIAQVYHDGILCAVLSPGDAEKLREFFGGNPNKLMGRSLAERDEQLGDKNG